MKCNVEREEAARLGWFNSRASHLGPTLELKKGRGEKGGQVKLELVQVGRY